MEQRLYAFWRYSPGDGRPTKKCLGGEIAEFKKDGYIERVNCKGYLFKPFKICILDEGLALQEKLDDLDSKYDAELSSLRRRYKKLFDDLIVIPK
jgi:hypothetical protein